MSDFTLAWIIWIGFFFAIEGEALFSKKRNVNTLSAHILEMVRHNWKAENVAGS